MSAARGGGVGGGLSRGVRRGGGVGAGAMSQWATVVPQSPVALASPPGRCGPRQRTGVAGARLQRAKNVLQSPELDFGRHGAPRAPFSQWSQQWLVSVAGSGLPWVLSERGPWVRELSKASSRKSLSVVSTGR